MRILIVEDDSVLSAGLKTSLKKEGYAVDSCEDGTKAERHIVLNHSNYDLYILDFLLPGKTGVELCQIIRKKEIVTPILMLTGVSDVHEKVLALNSGADDYVTKPFSIEELIARVRALLRRPEKFVPNETTFGALSLDSTNKKAFFKHKDIKLTLKEFGILDYLTRNSNHVISRDQILDHVWDFETNAFSNIVDVHITNLRKKLEQTGAIGILETVRGLGFKIKS